MAGARREVDNCFGSGGSRSLWMFSAWFVEIIAAVILAVSAMMPWCLPARSNPGPLPHPWRRREKRPTVTAT